MWVTKRRPHRLMVLIIFSNLFSISMVTAVSIMLRPVRPLTSSGPLKVFLRCAFPFGFLSLRMVVRFLLHLKCNPCLFCVMFAVSRLDAGLVGGLDMLPHVFGTEAAGVSEKLTVSGSSSALESTVVSMDVTFVNVNPIP